MRRPSPALVIASLALLVALTGTSYATVLNVPKNSVGTPQLKRNAVKPAKLAPNAVRTAHVLNGTLLAADFKAGQIPQGSKGDKGDTGAAGAPGLSGLERVEVESETGSLSFSVAVARCPEGKRLIGGGSSVVGPPGANWDKVVLRQSGPLTGERWQAVASEVNATAGNWHVEAWAFCAIVTG